MGNHPSNHQPLERPAVGKFGDLQTVGATKERRFDHDED